MPIPSRPIPDLACEVTAKQIDRLFEEAHFPCDRQQAVAYARDHLASADLLAVLDSIPDQIYHDPREIWQAIQRLCQQPHHAG